MSFLERIFGISKKQVNTSPTTDDFYRALISFMYGQAPVFIEDNLESFVRDGYASNADIYAIVSRIAKKAASVPWVLHKITNQKAYREYKSIPNEDIKARQRYKKKALEEIDKDPILDLWEKPNPLMRGNEYRFAVFLYKLICGNSFTLKVQAGERVSALHVLPGHKTKIELSGNFIDPIQGYSLTIAGWENTFDVNSVLHLKYFNPDFDQSGYSFYGLSPLRAARKTATASNDVMTAASSSLQNGGIKGIISQNGEQHDAESLQRAKQAYDNKKTAGNYKDLMFTELDVKYIQLAQSAADMQLQGLKTMTFRELCNIYSVPSVLFNDNVVSTKDNMGESRKAMVMDAVLPELEDMQDNYNEFLGLTKQGKYLAYDYTAIPELQPDLNETISALEKAHWMTPNQKLEYIGLPESELDYMEQHHFPQSLKAMGVEPTDENILLARMAISGDYNLK